MKILKTDNFISERMNINPITRTELDETIKNMRNTNGLKNVDLNNIDVSIFREFGYILCFDGKLGDMLTIGRLPLPFLRGCNKNLDGTRNPIAVSPRKNGDWQYVVTARMDLSDIDTTGSETNNNKIIKIFKSNLNQKDIQTVDDLKKFFDDHKLKYN